ncbi:9347_t:CDS:2 [Funneliformis geosporum]|nr:9347_t:CDS:2 [Funneliformis geosporum]
MEFLEFLDRYLKHFPEATPEQVNKAFQISNEHQESNEFDKKQKLNPLFESIYNIVKSQKDQLLEMQQDQQKNNVIEHNEELAVIEKKILYVRKSYKNLYDQLKKKSGCGLKKFLITGTSACGTYNDFEFLLNLTTTWYLADGKTSPELVYETTVVSLSLNGIAKKDFQEFDKREEKDQFFLLYKPEAGFVRNLSDFLKYSEENIVIVSDK